MIEVEILSGDFAGARKQSERFLHALAYGDDMRVNTWFEDLRVVIAFLGSAAALLDGDTESKEAYLFEVLARGRWFARIGWQFSEMETFLADDYLQLKPDLPLEAKIRNKEELQQIINQLKEGGVK